MASLPLSLSHKRFVDTALLRLPHERKPKSDLDFCERKDECTALQGKEVTHSLSLNWSIDGGMDGSEESERTHIQQFRGYSGKRSRREIMGFVESAGASRIATTEEGMTSMMEGRKPPL